MEEQDEACLTFEHKVAMLSLCSLRVSINYQLLENGNYQYGNLLNDDMSEIIEYMNWLEGYF